MTVTSRRVRAALRSVAAGPAVSVEPDVFEALHQKGALVGTRDRPEITDVGRHVLVELDARAGRVDALSLDRVAEELAAVVAELDQVAKTAEYFLAELGPVAPREALPFLKPVAVGLANRRGTPEELAEEFRHVWGGVEVMGGDAGDRLLAAELLSAASAPLDRIYAPVMSTALRIRETPGATSPATAAVLLHLPVVAGGRPPLEAFQALRARGLDDESAALLASAPAGPDLARLKRHAFLEALGTANTRPEPDAERAATFLTSVGEEPAAAVARVRAIARALPPTFVRPLTAGALLSIRHDLAPEELLNLLDKATALARSRKLAPTDLELGALALGLVHGLPASLFLRGEGGPPPGPEGHGPPPAALVALHAWIFRPAFEATAARTAPPPVPAVPPAA